MSLNELCTLYKHTAGTTAAIVHAAVIKRTQDRNESLNHAGWRIKLTATNAFFLSKLRDTVFIGAAQKIFAFFRVTHVDIVCEDINHITQNSLIKVRTGIILRKDILQSLILGFNSSHSRIDNRSNFRSMSR